MDVSGQVSGFLLHGPLWGQGRELTFIEAPTMCWRPGGALLRLGYVILAMACGGDIILPLGQMGKLRLRKATWLAQLVL